MPYIVIALFLFLISILEVKGVIKKYTYLHWYVFFVLVFFLIIFSGLSSIGFDYDTYSSEFKELHLMHVLEAFSHVQFEPFYVLLNIISPSFYFALLIISLISIGIKASVFYKKSSYPFVLLFLYFTSLFLLFEMGQYRQAIALSFSLLGIFSISQHEKRSWLYFIIAFFFHYSAIVSFFAYFVPSRLKKLYFYIGGVIFCCLFANIAKVIIPLSFDLLPGFIGSKLGLYYFLESEISISLFLLLFRVSLLALFYSFLFYYKVDNSTYIFLFNLYYLSVCMFLMFSFIPQIAGRGTLYFSIYDIFLLQYCVFLLRKVVNKILFFLCFSLLYFLMFFNFIFVWRSVLFPYQSILL